MKKLLLSLGVIVVYIVYTITQRHEASTITLPNRSTSGQTSGSIAAVQSGTTTGAPDAGGSAAAGSQKYKDGTYTGQPADAFYGNIQVAVTIAGGKITAVKFLDYPHDNPNSMAINQQAMPGLQQEAIQAQSANVNIISGATDTSQAFVQSLTSALNRAV